MIITEDEIIQRRMKDFKICKKAHHFKNSERHTVSRDELPVAILVLFLLHGVCRFPLGARGEKTHWYIPFNYKNHACAISLEKFGIRLYITNESKINPREVTGIINKTINYLEKNILTEIAKEQIETANITINNQFHKFEGQYHYFREKAHISFNPPKQEERIDDFSLFVDILNKSHKMSSEGSYNTIAMIDVYFSRLEHLLVLALPFSKFDRETDNLSSFVGMIWSDKLKKIMDINKTPANSLYSRLREVKEKYRNTFAHGGFEKKGASFYFHLSNYGAVPARMSDHRNSVHFNWFPIDSESYKEICQLFDEFDNFLREIQLPLAWRFAESGLDMSFDEKSITELLHVSNTQDSYEQWLEHRGYVTDLHDNADY